MYEINCFFIKIIFIFNIVILLTVINMYYFYDYYYDLIVFGFYDKILRTDCLYFYPNYISIIS